MLYQLDILVVARELRGQDAARHLWGGVNCNPSPHDGPRAVIKSHFKVLCGTHLVT